MKKITKAVILFNLFLVVNCFLLTTAESAVPHLINYQGRLTDSSGAPLNSSYNLTFRIYDAETAGNLVWEETQSAVVIQKGVFSILLGSVTALNLPFDKPYFLEIKVGSEVMSPRQRITSAGYAIRAEKADEAEKAETAKKAVVAENGAPKGAIIMWSGRIADIPSGWILCDGNNGTPDLRDKFIVGARQDDAGAAKTNITGSLTQTGGSTSITIANLPPHTHSSNGLTVNASGSHTHDLQYQRVVKYSWSASEYGANYPETKESYTASLETKKAEARSITYSGEHSHNIFGSAGSTGSGITYAQPYYALVFIMKKN